MAKNLRAKGGHYAKVYHYPCGVVDIVTSTSPNFRAKGWEPTEDYGRPGKAPKQKGEPERSGTAEAKAEDVERSMRRARAKVRRLALANDFRWFVTLTLDPQKIDRYSPDVVIRKLNQWCSNQVKRKGLRYVLVPERHKDGALHFHGFFSGDLEAVASGHHDQSGHMIYNLPAWTLGFTAAVEVYGDYVTAVAYVCKYIGKQGEKPGGRWYYSGGDLVEPKVTYADISWREMEEEFGDKVWKTYVPGQMIAIVNGVKEEIYADVCCPDCMQDVGD